MQRPVYDRSRTSSSLARACPVAVASWGCSSLRPRSRIPTFPPLTCLLLFLLPSVSRSLGGDFFAERCSGTHCLAPGKNCDANRDKSINRTVVGVSWIKRCSSLVMIPPHTKIGSKRVQYSQHPLKSALYLVAVSRSSTDAPDEN